MQGTTALTRKTGNRFVVKLAAAHIVAATLVVFVVAQAGPLVVDVVPRSALVGSLVAASILGVVIDILAVKKRSFSVGVPRQTPKGMLFLGDHAWVTPLVWGFDTGLIWTTYRVSFSSWLLLLLAFAGMAPPWAGLVYGLAFAIPLLAVMRYHHPSTTAPQLMPATPAQLAGIASMMVVAGCIAIVGSV